MVSKGLFTREDLDAMHERGVDGVPMLVVEVAQPTGAAMIESLRAIAVSLIVNS